MNTFHLKYFIDAVRLGGVAASADANHLTHSAVSQSIRALEAELGVPLLIHEKRKFQPTVQGKLLFEQGLIWLQNLENMKNQVKDTEEKVTGILNIVSPQSIVREILWKPILKFKKMHPQVRMKIILGAADFVKHNVRQGVSDLGFLLDDEELGDLKTLKLFRGEYVLISKRPGQKAGDLPLIVSSKSRMEVQQISRRIKKLTGDQPEVALEVQSWSIIKQYVKESDVFGIVPKFMIMPELQRGSLYEVKLNFEMPDYDIKCIWNTAADINPKVKAFLQMVK